MDWESIEKLSRPKEEISIERNLSRMCWEAVELKERRFFKKGKTHRDECNKQATQTEIQTTYLALKTSLNMYAKHSRSKTHTQNKSNQFYISKTRQFSEYILTHVFLVMAKLHCTCTCIKSSKEFACYVWKHSKSA